mmetsp:Transcript_14973/g.16659  ORF Transcript_14973/g.16659 Transcript_14973/m.16659 type:complete len:159 (+) Transcript_14973:244-720(+)
MGKSQNMLEKKLYKQQCKNKADSKIDPEDCKISHKFKIIIDGKETTKKEKPKSHGKQGYLCLSIYEHNRTTFVITSKKVLGRITTYAHHGLLDLAKKEKWVSKRIESWQVGGWSIDKSSKGDVWRYSSKSINFKQTKNTKLMKMSQWEIDLVTECFGK